MDQILTTSKKKVTDSFKWLGGEVLQCFLSALRADKSARVSDGKNSARRADFFSYTVSYAASLGDECQIFLVRYIIPCGSFCAELFPMVYFLSVRYFISCGIFLWELFSAWCFLSEQHLLSWGIFWCVLFSVRCFSQEHYRISRKRFWSRLFSYAALSTVQYFIPGNIFIIWTWYLPCGVFLLWVLSLILKLRHRFLAKSKKRLESLAENISLT